ncbi:sugar dehydrogenase complex small subunit [Mycetohabitans rhizoxinica]|uniref:Membrane bound FAD containing D-sorbitol dehydrogenase n=1 Tax=Mycetohabitans rhizoxinica TaxID=412963 RepID=A0ABZ2PVW4_9BURK
MNRDTVDQAAATVHSGARRAWLQKTLACVAAGLVGSPLLRAAAQGNDALLDAFMTVSRALTGKATLPRDVGGRLAEALQKKTPDLAQRVQQLAGALASGKLNDAQTALALRILQAWYVGEVDGMVVIYEQALIGCRTYGRGGAAQLLAYDRRGPDCDRDLPAHGAGRAR